MRSKRLDALKYYGILGICLLHSSYLIDSSGGVGYYTYVIVSSVSGIVLPTYFFLSGYFFALNFSFKSIRGNIVSRLKKIVVPYCVYQIIFIHLTNLLVNLNNKGLGYTFIDETYTPSGIKEILKFVCWGYRDPPLWYLRVLFEFVLITPSLISIMKESQLYSFIVIGIMLSVNFIYYGEIAYASIFYWSPVYFIGLYIAIYHKEIVLAPNIMSMYKTGSLLVFIGFCIILCTLSFNGISYVNYFKYAGWMLSPFFMIGISHFMPYLELYQKQFDAEFLIYCIHYPIIHIVSCFISNFINKEVFGGCGIWLLTLVITFVVCHLIHILLITHFKKIYNFLYGRY